MDNQSLTQEKSSNSYIETKKKIFNTIKENLNYIYIVLMIIANCLLSLLKVEGGELGVRYPQSSLGWVLWATQILFQTLIGVLILNAFRRQGIKIGHQGIKATYEKYLNSLCLNSKEKRPRGLKEYLRVHSTKDSISKSTIFVILSVFVGSVAISANLNNLLSLIANIIFAVGFGIKALLDAEEYVLTELVLWYQLKIAEVTDHNKTEPAKELKNGKTRNQKPRTRHISTSGVQQKEECSTRPETFNTIESSEPTS